VLRVASPLGVSVSENQKLVHKRKGARRRSKVKLLVQLFFSLVFLGTAALLSAGIVRVVERPVAPWKKGVEQVAEVAEPAQVVVVDEKLRLIEEADPITDIELSKPIDLRLMPRVGREPYVDDLAEAAPLR